MTNEDVEKYLPNLKGWTLDRQCESGSLFWTPKIESDDIIFATPNWEGENELPIETFDGENYKTFAHVKLPDTTLEIQLAIYKAIVEAAIKSLDK